MIRRNKPCKDGVKACCQEYRLGRYPKAERSLGCPSYLKKVLVAGAQVRVGGIGNEVGKAGGSWTQSLVGQGNKLEPYAKCNGKPLESFQRGWGEG